jgi:hypothetical protein
MILFNSAPLVLAKNAIDLTITTVEFASPHCVQEHDDPSQRQFLKLQERSLLNGRDAYEEINES